jgi:hypothetical protein
MTNIVLFFHTYDTSIPRHSIPSLTSWPVPQILHAFSLAPAESCITSSSRPHPVSPIPSHRTSTTTTTQSTSPRAFPIYILSTGVNPNNLIPFPNTCLAALYKLSLALNTGSSLPTTCKWS